MCEIQPPTWYLKNKIVISWQEPGYIEIDTVGKLTRRSQLGSLALCSVNNDFAWLCNSWDHLQHCACPSWGTLLVMSYPVHHACMSSTMKALAAAALELHWSDTMVMLCEVMLWRLPQLLRQPRKKLCYGCHASQERINICAVPMASRVFFQPLSSSLA